MTKHQDNLSNNEAKQPPEGRFLTSYRLSITLIIALLWPVVTLVIFLTIKTPLLLFLSQMPELFSSSTHITVGPVNLERGLKEIAVSPEIKRAVGALSPEALRFLVGHGNAGFGYLKKDWEHTDFDAPMVLELKKHEFVTVVESGEGEPYPNRYHLTGSGKDAYELVLKTLFDQLFVKPTTAGKP